MSLPRPARAAGDRPLLGLIVVALALIATAGAIGLLEPTETRYAEIAREMRASGDYLVPRLDGLPHFHKPPLAYWTLCAGMAVFGENEWGARLPMTLIAVAALALTAALARRRFAALGISPGLAVWTLGASIYFLLIGRSVASDPVLALAVAGFWALAPSPWALAALGAGFLAKGPVVFVSTVAAVLAAAAWGRERSSLRLLGPGWGWLLFGAVALPWYLVVVSRTPGLARYFLVDQLWERYTTEVHQRGGSPGYFIAVLLVGALPWTPALIVGAWRLWRERAHAEARLLACWLLVPLIFLSFSGSKLPAYLLPSAPAAALIAAYGLQRQGRAVAWSGAALLGLVAIAGWWLGPRALAHAVGIEANTSTSLPLPAHAGLVCMAYAALCLALARPVRAALLFVFGFLALTAALAPYEGPLGSPRPLARTLAENRAPREPVVEFARFNAGLSFYLRERVGLLEVPRETVFAGEALPPDPRLTRAALVALASRGRVWILGPHEKTPELASALGLRYQRLARWRKDDLGFVTRGE